MKGIVGSEIRLPTEDRLATIICMQFGYLAAFARHDIEDHLVGEAHRVGAESTLPYLDFGARMYDAKLVRWNTYDPMAEKYYGINPYVYCAGDPVNRVDKRGLFMDNFIFEKGRYKERVPVPNEPHKLIVINNEETIEATFADPDNDPSSITNNTRVHIVSNEDISNIIHKQNRFHIKFVYGFSTLFGIVTLLLFLLLNF